MCVCLFVCLFFCVLFFGACLSFIHGGIASESDSSTWIRNPIVNEWNATSISIEQSIRRQHAVGANCYRLTNVLISVVPQLCLFGAAGIEVSMVVWLCGAPTMEYGMECHGMVLYQ